jgi:histone H4
MSTMAGKGGSGKGGKGKGANYIAKRHMNMQTQDPFKGITKPAVRRLCRRGGVKRINGFIYEETRGVIKEFLEKVLHDALTYTEHAHRKTISPIDIVYALKRSGRTLYGFGV